MVKIAILDDYQGVSLSMADWSLLQPNVNLEVFTEWLHPNSLAERLYEFDIIAAMRERTVFNRTLLKKLTNLKLLVTTGMRNTSIDMDAAKEFGIQVSGTSGSSHSTAELTWGLILSLAKNIPSEDRSIRSGSWQTSLGIDLEGKVLGVMGLGRLGAKVATIGLAFGMSVIAWSQNLTEERASEFGVKLVSKDTLFSESDFLSIHLQLSDRTIGLVGSLELGIMKPTAYIVNTSRGPIIDTNSLQQALKNGTIRGAGLDVFDMEPIPLDNEYLVLKNTVLTPHVGYVTEEVYKVFYSETVEDIKHWLDGKPLRVLNNL